MIGCNYWASHAGIEMWKNCSAETIRGDLKALSQCGVEYLRVFPLWRDFQPVKSQYLCESIGAEVLARNDEGNVIMAKNKLGKGVVYFLGFVI